MLKVGDKVKIKKDLGVDKIYANKNFVRSIAGYRGESAVITKIIKHPYNETSPLLYLIDKDFGRWQWTKDMFEKIDKINSYIINFYSYDNIKINVEQDINRPNNPDDYQLILDYIYLQYGNVVFDIIELDDFKEINI